LPRVERAALQDGHSATAPYRTVAVSVHRGGRGRRRSGSAAGCQQVVDARGWPRCALLGSSWTSSCYSLGVLVPGGGLVVAGAGFEAAVQDSDETVAELAQGGVVADVAVPQRVVVGGGLPVIRSGR
jgi:hypothetical protein